MSSWKILCNFLYHRLARKMDIQDCHSTSLEPLVHCQNVGQNVKTFSKYHFYRSYFGRCSSKLAQLVRLPFYWGRSTFCSDILHNLSVLIRRCYKDVYVKSFFPHPVRLWIPLPIECFPLTNYDLNGFTSRINSHLLTLGSF